MKSKWNFQNSLVVESAYALVYVGEEFELKALFFQLPL